MIKRTRNHLDAFLKGAICIFLLVLSLVSASHAVSFKNVEGGVEWVDTDDISLLQTSLLSDFVAGSWDSTLSLAYGRYSMDYEPVPFDFNGLNRHLSEENLAVQYNTRKQLTDPVWILVGAGVYDGFTNYRSVWLDEYFRQQFQDLGEFPGDTYLEADPKGINASAGIRWEYNPGNSIAELGFAWLRDDVSPGYEIDFDGLVRGLDRLKTGSINLSLENVLSKTVRSVFVVRASDTTARSVRYGAEFSLFAALGEKWISRLKLGAATEDPTFDAYYGSLALEYQASENVSIFVDGRYYDDTGEIENALLFTSAAPGVTTRRLGIGVRWVKDTWSFRAYLAPLKSDYEPTREAIDFFQNLYADREWNIFQIAARRVF